MHIKNKHEYRKYLHSTAIVLCNPIITNIIETLFATVYTPERPVEMINKEDGPKDRISNLYNFYD